MCPFVLASDAVDVLWHYAHRAWTPENSALISGVGTITQTTDGYLWLGTATSLIRFDGVRMVSWTPPPAQRLPGGPVRLVGARDGTLWVGATGGLASWKNGRLTQYPELSGFYVFALLEDRDGTVWAGGAWGDRRGTARLCAFRNRSAKCYGGDGSLGGAVSYLYEDAGGGLWAATSTGLWHWKPGPPIRYTVALGARIGTSSLGVTPSSLTQGENGRDLTLSADGEVRRFADGKVTDYPLPGAPSPLTANSLLRDRYGALWIGTDTHGLVYSHGRTTHFFTSNDGLSGGRVLCLFEDREGTIWVATSEGLDSFHELPVASLSVSEGLSSSSIRGVLAARDGSIWISTRAGLNRLKDGRMEVYRARSDSGLRGDDTGTLFEDDRSRIWVQAYPGLAVFEAGRFRAVPSVPPGTLTSIASDRHGGLWLQLLDNPNDYGLVHLFNGKVIEKVTWKELGGGPGAGLVVDPDGGVWTGLFIGGIAWFRDGKIRNLPLNREDTGSRRVFNISRAPDGALWVAGEQGLSRFADGRVSTLTTANGLPCNVVHWIMTDNVSSYWLLTACGLVRIPRSDLDAWTADPKRKIQPTVFDWADGIALRDLLPPWRPHVTKTSGGIIWFQNGNKVSIIDPSHIAFNALPPPVHIEQIASDGKVYDPEQGLRLPPLTRNLTIDYTALSFVAPEKVRLRYKLEGQDPDWREVINDREVQYSNLAPGPYRFLVTACNNSGVWNEVGDTLEFSISPTYYQTNWFRALCAVAVMALLWLAYRFRVRQVRQEITIGLEAKISERTRIARDLHDTLLQSFHGLLYRFHAARNLLPGRPDEAIEALDSALIRAELALDEGRLSIQELRSGLSAESGFDQMLVAIGQELASTPDGKSSSPSFNVIVEGERRGLSPIVREEILRVARELLQNAFRHAHARAIEAEIRYANDVFRVIVRDDGKGIDPKVLKEGGRPGHWGMPGVHERARGIGARLEFWSEAGAGTEVRLTLPAALAYQKSRNGGRLRLFRKRRMHERES